MVKVPFVEWQPTTTFMPTRLLSVALGLNGILRRGRPQNPPGRQVHSVEHLGLFPPTRRRYAASGGGNGGAVNVQVDPALLMRTGVQVHWLGCVFVVSIEIARIISDGIRKFDDEHIGTYMPQLRRASL
eukprot:2375181-Pleurochrysis_carterae.AAC.1